MRNHVLIVSKLICLKINEIIISSFSLRLIFACLLSFFYYYTNILNNLSFNYCPFLSYLLAFFLFLCIWKKLVFSLRSNHFVDYKWIIYIWFRCALNYLVSSFKIFCILRILTPSPLTRPRSVTFTTKSSW